MGEGLVSETMTMWVQFVVKDVITSPLSLARVLWWYGEDDSWSAALGLAPVEVADLASRFAELRNAPEVVELLWPGAPLADAHLVLGTIEYLEGHPRPAVRRHRRGGPLIRSTSYPVSSTGANAGPVDSSPPTT